jgi:hypothetical protein
MGAVESEDAFAVSVEDKTAHVFDAFDNLVLGVAGDDVGFAEFFAEGDGFMGSNGDYGQGPAALFAALKHFGDADVFEVAGVVDIVEYQNAVAIGLGLTPVEMARGST